MAGLNDLNLDLFTSFGRDFLKEKLSTETNLYEVNRTKLPKQESYVYKITEQTGLFTRMWGTPGR